jgi:hypothetical protein
VADEGSFRGNRQNVFELGVAHAERVVLALSPARRPALKIKPIRLPGFKPGDMRRVNTERHQPSFKKGVGGSERITAANEDDPRGTFAAY